MSDTPEQTEVGPGDNIIVSEGSQQQQSEEEAPAEDE